MVVWNVLIVGMIKKVVWVKHYSQLVEISNILPLFRFFILITNFWSSLPSLSPPSFILPVSSSLFLLLYECMMSNMCVGVVCRGLTFSWKNILQKWLYGVMSLKNKKLKMMVDTPFLEKILKNIGYDMFSLLKKTKQIWYSCHET